MDDKYPNALSMLGTLELLNDDWVKAKDTFRAAKDSTDGKDSYSLLSLVRIILMTLNVSLALLSMVFYVVVICG